MPEPITLETQLKLYNKAQAKLALDRLNDKLDGVTENNLKESIKEFEKKIIGNLQALKDKGDPLPPNITQELLMNWCEYYIKDANDANTNDNYIKKIQALTNIMSPLFLDRLILGRGQEGYEKNQKKLAETGRQFITSLMLSGAPEAQRLASSIQRTIFKEVRRDLAMLRLKLYDYVENRYRPNEEEKPDNLNEEEKQNATSIHAATTEALREKWEALLAHVNMAKVFTGKENDSQWQTDLLALSQAVIPLFQAQHLPDFVTKKDLYKLCICDPARLTKLKVHENIAFLRRIGDLDKFIRKLTLKSARLKKISAKNTKLSEGDPRRKAGMDQSEDINKLIEQLNSSSKKEFLLEEQKKEYDERIELLNPSVRILEDRKHADEKLKEFEKRMQNESQLKNFLGLLEGDKLQRSQLSSDEYTALSSHLIEANASLQRKQQGSPQEILEELKFDNKELKAEFEKLQKMARVIKKDESQKDNYLKIQERLKEISSTRRKINNLVKKYKDAKTINPSPIEKFSENIKKLADSNREKVSSKKPSKKGMALYAIIMTQKSIDEGAPTREYLDKLYKTKGFDSFISNTALGREKLRKKINALEKKLGNDKKFTVQPPVNAPDLSNHTEVILTDTQSPKLPLAQEIASQLKKDLNNAPKKVKDAMQAAANKLEKMTEPSENLAGYYAAIFTELKSIKDAVPGTSTKKYRQMVYEHAEQAVENILDHIEKRIKDSKVPDAAIVNDSTSKAGEIMKYLEALQTKWEVEEKALKLTGKALEQHTKRKNFLTECMNNIRDMTDSHKGNPIPRIRLYNINQILTRFERTLDIIPGEFQDKKDVKDSLDWLKKQYIAPPSPLSHHRGSLFSHHTESVSAKIEKSKQDAVPPSPRSKL